MCHTTGCVNAAAGVLQSIDTSIEPCDDFYDFACGKFISDTTLTDDKVSVDTFSVARDKMQSQLLQLIDSPIEPDDLEYDDFDFVRMNHFQLNYQAESDKSYNFLWQIISIGKKSVCIMYESIAN